MTKLPQLLPTQSHKRFVEFFYSISCYTPELRLTVCPQGLRAGFVPLFERLEGYRLIGAASSGVTSSADALTAAISSTSMTSAFGASGSTAPLQPIRLLQGRPGIPPRISQLESLEATMAHSGSLLDLNEH